jgi:hypothetical protein
MSDEARIRRAAARYGPEIDHVAKQYGISGATLLVKLAKGESGFQANRTSSAGAKGWTQFMPATRADYVKRYGVDPWASPEQAIKATTIYIKNAGNIAAYNPGMPSYTNYILGQDVGKVGSNAGGGGGGGGGRTLVVGDSLGVGTAPYLKKQLGDVSADVRVGRTSQQGLSVLRRELASGDYDRIIFDIGSNDGSAAELRHTLKAAQKLAGGTPIFVPTVNGPLGPAKNKVIRGSGVNVVPWETSLTDGIHSANYGSRAKQIAAAVGSTPGAAGGGGGSFTPMSPVSSIGTPGADAIRAAIRAGGSGVGASLPAAPSFAAGPTLAGQGVPSGGSAPSGQAAQSLSDKLAAAQALVADVPAVPMPQAVPGRGGGGGAATVPSGGPVGRSGGGALKGHILESFYRGAGGINTDEGKVVGRDFVTGHEDHVHVAADTHEEAVQAARVAQKKFGLTVRELAPFDPVDPVHTQGSFHYSGRAADVSGDPAKMAAYSRWIAKRR